MKAKLSTIIIAAVLALQVNFLFAGNEKISAPVAKESAAISIISLAPTTPKEATFDDMPMEMTSPVELAPTTPAVADFEDVVDDSANDLNALAPVTPAEADFE